MVWKGWLCVGWRASLWALGAVLCLVSFASFVGCVGVSAVDDHGRKVSVHAPAWPWSDVAQTFERLQVDMKTNGVKFTMKDGNTDSHFSPVVADLVERSVGAGVSAAVAAFAPGAAGARRRPVEEVDDELPRVKPRTSPPPETVVWHVDPAGKIIIFRTNAPAGTNANLR